jgi:SAM-dependent methyltransferase
VKKGGYRRLLVKIRKVHILDNKYDNQRMYTDLAWTWPIICPPERYSEEAELLAKIINKHSRNPVNTLFNIGCGGGCEDFTLKKYFRITGVDISENMLSLARILNPEVSYLQDDMRRIRLKEKFDAVIITDAIGSMITEADLGLAFLTAYEHLKPGGVFVTLAERTTEHFKQNETRFSTHAADDVEISFIENYYDPDSSDTTFEATFIYLIRKKGTLEIHEDHHLAGIFPLETWRRLLDKVGFETHVEQVKLSDPAGEQSLPIFVCTIP